METNRDRYMEAARKIIEFAELEGEALVFHVSFVTRVPRQIIRDSLNWHELSRNPEKMLEAEKRLYDYLAEDV